MLAVAATEAEVYQFAGFSADVGELCLLRAAAFHNRIARGKSKMIMITHIKTIRSAIRKQLQYIRRDVGYIVQFV